MPLPLATAIKNQTEGWLLLTGQTVTHAYTKTWSKVPEYNF